MMRLTRKKGDAVSIKGIFKQPNSRKGRSKVIA
jgi:hypothetical protein